MSTDKNGKDICKDCKELKSECACTVWRCEECTHKWTSGIFITPGWCPKCNCENIEHF